MVNNELEALANLFQFGVIFESGLYVAPETIDSWDITTPGEMCVLTNPGNIESLVAAELEKIFTQENGFNGW